MSLINTFTLHTIIISSIDKNSGKLIYHYLPIIVTYKIRFMYMSIDVCICLSIPEKPWINCSCCSKTKKYTRMYTNIITYIHIYTLLTLSLQLMSTPLFRRSWTSSTLPSFAADNSWLSCSRKSTSKLLAAEMHVIILSSAHFYIAYLLYIIAT